jgi:hypothetical protein
MVAVEAARAVYAEHMGGVGAGAEADAEAEAEAGAARSVPVAAVYRLHADAVAAARRSLSSAKTLADRRQLDDALALLTEVCPRCLYVPFNIATEHHTLTIHVIRANVRCCIPALSNAFT